MNIIAIKGFKTIEMQMQIRKLICLNTYWDIVQILHDCLAGLLLKKRNVVGFCQDLSKVSKLRGDVLQQVHDYLALEGIGIAEPAASHVVLVENEIPSFSRHRSMAEWGGKRQLVR